MPHRKKPDGTIIIEGIRWGSEKVVFPTLSINLIKIRPVDYEPLLNKSDRPFVLKTHNVKTSVKVSSSPPNGLLRQSPERDQKVRTVPNKEKDKRKVIRLKKPALKPSEEQNKNKPSSSKQPMEILSSKNSVRKYSGEINERELSPLTKARLEVLDILEGPSILNNEHFSNPPELQAEDDACTFKIPDKPLSRVEKEFTKISKTESPVKISRPDVVQEKKKKEEKSLVNGLCNSELLKERDRVDGIRIVSKKQKTSASKSQRSSTKASLVDLPLLELSKKSISKKKNASKKLKVTKERNNNVKTPLSSSPRSVKKPLAKIIQAEIIDLQKHPLPKVPEREEDAFKKCPISSVSEPESHPLQNSVGNLGNSIGNLDSNVGKLQNSIGNLENNVGKPDSKESASSISPKKNLPKQDGNKPPVLQLPVSEPSHSQNKEAEPPVLESEVTPEPEKLNAVRKPVLKSILKPTVPELPRERNNNDRHKDIDRKSFLKPAAPLKRVEWKQKPDVDESPSKRQRHELVVPEAFKLKTSFKIPKRARSPTPPPSPSPPPSPPSPPPAPVPEPESPNVTRERIRALFAPANPTLQNGQAKMSLPEPPQYPPVVSFMDNSDPPLQVIVTDEGNNSSPNCSPRSETGSDLAECSGSPERSRSPSPETSVVEPVQKKTEAKATHDDGDSDLDVLDIMADDYDDLF